MLYWISKTLWMLGFSLSLFFMHPLPMPTVPQGGPSDPIADDQPIDTTSPVPTTPAVSKTPIADELIGKTFKEKANIKGQRIAQKVTPGTYVNTQYGLTIETRDITPIDGGVQVFARAWKNGKQLGFGTDGTTEWERFRFFNPPVMISDPVGGDVDVTRHDPRGAYVEKYREDPLEALRGTLAHTIEVSSRTDTTVVVGKVGNTTSTFFSAAQGAGSPTAAFTGFLSGGGTGGGTAWATERAQTPGTEADNGSDLVISEALSSTVNPNFRRIRRGIFMFDTSAIPDTDVISSATASMTCNTGCNSSGVGNLLLNLYSAVAAGTTALVVGDFNISNYGSTAFSTGIATNAISTAAAPSTVYNNWILNASGIAFITKTGVTEFGLLSENDATNVSPTWSSNTASQGYFNAAGAAGTTSDPKLVVVHAAAASSPTDINGGLILFN